jgi:tRNA-2-methylthio-N6-dimethylallyladenosine synthase
MKKYHIIIFGCQMNISDAERVSAVLESKGFRKAENMDKANLVVVTMCSVRQSAVNRVHGLAEKIRKLKTKNPKLKAILTGCILKKDKNIFLNEFDFIVDIKDIKHLLKILRTNPVQIFDDRQKSARGYLDITPKYQNKFSANVPIMTGCNNFCSYCVVPYTRDREISRSAKNIILEIKNLVRNGYKEIWLLGQNVNSYKDGPINFPKLLKMVNNISGKFWIRFTSSHPKDFSDKVVEAMATCEKVTPYLNLPIQSGDDKILKAMNRHYTIKDYKNKIKKLRKKIPDISLSTDIIVGFPCETKKQFENTAKLFREIKYDMAYINKYSPRPGTAAEKLKDNVSITEKKQREKILTEILKKTALEKNKKLIGKEIDVLINENRDDNYFGKDKHYKTIKIKSNKNILGKITKVKIIEAEAFILKGALINDS